MQLDLLETWSLRYSDPLAFDLPAGWKLATHQMEAYQALHDSNIDVVFDTAMTGDGKSLAAYLPLLRRAGLGNGVITYPTNELIRDQNRQFLEFMHLFGTPLRHRCLNGLEIAKYAAAEDTSRYTAIKDLIYGQQVLLTNPDIFHLIESFAYTNPMQNPAKLAQEFSNRFRYVVFDEFHIFDAPQIASVLDAMLFIRANANEGYPTKYLFLSATPSPSLQSGLEKAGFRTRIVQGSYAHGLKPEGPYRSILQSAGLELIKSEGSTGGVLAWAQENLDTITSFYRDYPDTKGAIICNSVFTAKKLHAWLKAHLPADITVGENTGLTGQQARRAAFDTKLMVATSTVDVGVDFKLNFLVFESLNAGTFIQRLGRLGRHEGFATYKAIALLPSFIVEKIKVQYSDGQQIDRWSFFNNLKERIFPPEQGFSEYIPRWGGVQACLRLAKLVAPSVRITYTPLVERYQSHAVEVFRVSKDTQRRMLSLKEQPAVHAELRAFRGAGNLDAWIFDSKTNAIGTVNVLRLLSGTTFELLTKEDAEDIAERLGEAFYESRLGLYVRVIGYEDERLRVDIRFRGLLLDNLHPTNQATERRGFYLEARHPHILKVSRALEQTAICTCVSQEDLATLRRQCRLPAMFELREVTDETSARYSVAFGQDALLLDSLLHWRRDTGSYIV